MFEGVAMMAVMRVAMMVVVVTMGGSDGDGVMSSGGSEPDTLKR